MGVEPIHRLALFSTLPGLMSATLLVPLYGELYDVSSIATWHPGGAAILHQLHSLSVADATPLFESQHSLRDASQMRAKLSPYRWNATRPSANRAQLQLYTFREDGFYRVLRKRVAAHFEDHPW